MMEDFEKFSCSDPDCRWRGLIRRQAVGMTAVCLKLDDVGIRLFHNSSKIKAGEVDGFFVKRYNLPGVVTQIRRFFKSSRPLNVLYGAAHLESLQIPTPRVLAALSAWQGLRRREYLVTEFLRENDRLMNEVFNSLPREEVWQMILEKFIPMLAKLHDSGALHGDLNLRNLFLSAEGAAGLIDLDGMEISAFPLNMDKRAREIARIVSSFLFKCRLFDRTAEYTAEALANYARYADNTPDEKNTIGKTEIFISRAKKYL